MYKILEKYTQLKVEQNMKLDDEKRNLASLDEDLIKNFMELYDKHVKVIHTNQEHIEKDLKFLYKESDKLAQNTKTAINIYDDFLEYLKEAGDLVNWCNIIEKEMSEVYNTIATKQRGNYTSPDLS
jgi:hypothetical protein